MEISAKQRLVGRIGMGTVFDDRAQTYILTDEDGNELQGVFVEDAVVFDATPNDIRIGKTAVTDSGAVVGEKNIPCYITIEGAKFIPAGKDFVIQLDGDECQYTKLQVLICRYNSSLANSVATEYVSINGKVYTVNSTDVLAEVTVDIENSLINLGVTNTGSKPAIVRFFTYKEEY